MGVEFVDDPPGIRVWGELDISNHHILAEAVTAEMAHSGNIRLELSGVDFADAGTIHLLSNAAQSVKAGGRITLVSPPAMVRKVLKVLDADLLPNLEIVEA